MSVASVDRERLTRELDDLAAISDAPAPAVTRVVFTETDRRARDYVHGLCEDASLLVREDAVGNTFARWIGAEPELPAVGTGSHIDAIPNAGRYDGTVGVLGGLEAMRALARAGFEPRRSIDLTLFTSEEPTRFGIGCLGSRFLAGLLDESAGERLQGTDGRSLNEARAEAGFHGPLSSVPLARWGVLGVRRAAHRTGAAARTRRSCHRRRHRDRRAGEPPDRRRGRRRPCRCRADAGTPRRISRGGGDRAGGRIRGPGHRVSRHGGNRRCVRRVSGRREQRAEPRTPRGRRARHRSRAARLRCSRALLRRAVKSPRAVSVTVSIEPVNADPPARCAPADRRRDHRGLRPTRACAIST